MNNEVKIIGGRWRGKKIQVAEQKELRPTLGRVRETLFNWLMPEIVGARCLDVFAGTGALGLEALSRGAETVVFVEQNPTTLDLIKKNCQLLHTSSSEWIAADALVYLNKCIAQPFDIIFLDPPFHMNLLEPALHCIQQNAYLAPKGLIYFECETTIELTTKMTGWTIWRHQKAGQSQYGLLLKEH